MTSREQFEETFRKAYPEIPPSHKDTMLEWYNLGTDDEPDWGYYSPLARQAFDWWQLSREAVEVELPELFEDDRHAVTDAIRAAGIKVK